MHTCSFASSPLIPGPAEYAITTSLSHIQDTWGLTDWTAGEQSCAEDTHDLFVNKSQPLALYSVSVDSSRVYSNCTSQNADGVGLCEFYAELSFASQLIQSTKSVPGTTKLEIILNASAIVGGIQFLMWFLEKLGD